MGNRGTIVFTRVGPDQKPEFSPAINLQRNTGPESIYAFLAELERRYVWGDDPYASCARFTQLVGDFFDSDYGHNGRTVYLYAGPKSDSLNDIDKLDFDNDNGVYLVTVPDHSIRHFVYDESKPGQLREMTAAEVATEKEQALASDYADGIRTQFTEMDDRLYSFKDIKADPRSFRQRFDDAMRSPSVKDHATVEAASLGGRFDFEYELIGNRLSMRFPWDSNLEMTCDIESLETHCQAPALFTDGELCFAERYEPDLELPKPYSGEELADDPTIIGNLAKGYLEYIADCGYTQVREYATPTQSPAVARALAERRQEVPLGLQTPGPELDRGMSR